MIYLFYIQKVLVAPVTFNSFTFSKCLEFPVAMGMIIELPSEPNLDASGRPINPTFSITSTSSSEDSCSDT